MSSNPIDDPEPGDDNYSEPEPEKKSFDPTDICILGLVVILFLALVKGCSE